MQLASPFQWLISSAPFFVLCADPGAFISAKDEQSHRQTWSKGETADKCDFPHPDLTEEEGHRFWGVSSNLGSYSFHIHIHF